MITQLNPSIPVTVITKDSRTGVCIAWNDYGSEHHIMWCVVFDDTGECWWVPNPEIRLQPNWSLERRFWRQKPDDNINDGQWAGYSRGDEPKSS